MNASDFDSQHEEVVLLLPWYVNETLQSAERERVAKHISRCGECADSVASMVLLRDELADDTLTPIVPTPNPALVLERAGTQATNRRVLAIAASIVLAAAIILMAVTTDNSIEPNVFEVATSSGEPVEMHYGVTLKFVEGTSEPERLSVFERVGATFVRDEGDGIFTANIALTARSIADLDDVTNRIEAYPEVAEAAITSMSPPREELQ